MMTFYQLTGRLDMAMAAALCLASSGFGKRQTFVLVGTNFHYSNTPLRNKQMQFTCIHTCTCTHAHTNIHIGPSTQHTHSLTCGVFSVVISGLGCPADCATWCNWAMWLYVRIVPSNYHTIMLEIILELRFVICKHRRSLHHNCARGNCTLWMCMRYLPLPPKSYPCRVHSLCGWERSKWHWISHVWRNTCKEEMK